MTRYKIKYWFNGNINKTYVEAENRNQALIVFYMSHVCDDVIEVVEDV